MTLADILSDKNEHAAAVLTVLRWLDSKPKPRRRRWTARTAGSVKQRLCKKLQAAGIPIPDAECLWSQQGGYRSKHWDLARWGADFRDDSGRHWTLASWCTMTDCARYGVTWCTEEDSFANVYSAKPGQNSEKSL